jgi:hypothetical protein
MSIENFTAFTLRHQLDAAMHSAGRDDASEDRHPGTYLAQINTVASRWCGG